MSQTLGVAVMVIAVLILVGLVIGLVVHEIRVRHSKAVEKSLMADLADPYQVGLEDLRMDDMSPPFTKPYRGVRPSTTKRYPGGSSARKEDDGNSTSVLSPYVAYGDSGSSESHSHHSGHGGDSSSHHSAPSHDSGGHHSSSGYDGGSHHSGGGYDSGGSSGGYDGGGGGGFDGGSSSSF